VGYYTIVLFQCSYRDLIEVLIIHYATLLPHGYIEASQSLNIDLRKVPESLRLGLTETAIKHEPL
jgi:hypothetical protein